MRIPVSLQQHHSYACSWFPRTLANSAVGFPGETFTSRCTVKYSGWAHAASYTLKTGFQVSGAWCVRGTWIDQQSSVEIGSEHRIREAGTKRRANRGQRNGMLTFHKYNPAILDPRSGGGVQLNPRHVDGYPSRRDVVHPDHESALATSEPYAPRSTTLGHSPQGFSPNADKVWSPLHLPVR